MATEVDDHASQSVRLHIDGKMYRVEKVLKHHKDQSVSYRAIGTSKAVFVVRAFQDKSDAPGKLLRTKSGNAAFNGVIDYVSLGSASVDGALPPRFPESGTVTCSVRPFRKQTLEDISNGDLARGQFDTMQTIVTLAAGLLELHTAGITHGDLRPSNVIVDASREAALVDYGVSFNTHLPATTTDALFAAPEVLRAGVVSSASDVYSFGKLTRTVLQKGSRIDRVTLERINSLVARCLVDEPTARPLMKDVVERMLLATDHNQYRSRFLTNRLASFADLDARAPGLIEAHPERAEQAIDRVLQSLNSISLYRPVHRLNQLTDADSTHLIASLAFMELRERRVQYFGSTDMLKAMEYAPAESGEISPAWKDRLLDIMRTPTAEEAANLRAKYSFMPAADLALMLEPFSQEEIENQLQLAAESRSEILSQDAFVHSEHVAAIMSASCPGITTDEVRILRDLGYLLSVEDSGHNIYPLFQFERRGGLPFQTIKDVDDIFAETDPTGWGRMSWWFSVNRFLQGGTPAEHIRAGEAPDLVTDALRRVLAA